MRVESKPENFVEWVLSLAGAVPTPLIDTFQAMVKARAIMAASKLGIFKALKDKPATATEVAAQLGTDRRGTEKLLNSLVGVDYLTFDGQGYSLTAMTRKWLLPDSPHSLHDNMLHRFLEWEAAGHFEEYVRTGRPLNVHEGMQPDQWATYQRGMRSLAGISAAEVARSLPVPAGARQMLDLGGSHGFYSVAVCRKHPHLKSTILDLPAAVEQARPILARENMGDRVVHRADNVITADLGEGQWDIVFASQLLHHLSEETNQDLLRRVARALRPGGVVAVLEVIRPSSPQSVGQTGLLLDLFFAVTSPSGSWSVEELSSWQSQAGLKPGKSITLLSIPGAVIQSASK